MITFFFSRIKRKFPSSDSDSSGSDNSSSTVLFSKKLPSPPNPDCVPSLTRHNAFYERPTHPEGSSASTSKLHPEKPEGIYLFYFVLHLMYEWMRSSVSRSSI